MADLTCNFFSYTLKRSVTIYIILPSITSGDTKRKGNSHKALYQFPVLYLLHGYSNDYSSWIKYTSIQRYAEEQRIAVVTFSAENNWYINLNDVVEKSRIGHMQFADYYKFLNIELPDFITNTFPISKRKEDTYIAGLSMGGYGAMVHAFGNPDKYKAVGSFSPRPTLWDGWNSKDEKIPEYLKEYDPLELLTHLKKSEIPNLYYSYGEKDSMFEIQNWFREKIDELGICYTLDVQKEYRHEWALWDLEILKFLNWLPRTDEYFNNKEYKKV